MLFCQVQKPNKNPTQIFSFCSDFSLFVKKLSLHFRLVLRCIQSLRQYLICSFLSFLIYMAVDIERNRCLRVTQLFADTDDVCAIGDADRGHCMPKCVRMQILDSILLSKSCKIRCGSLRIQNLTVFSCKAVPFSRVSLCQQISCLFPLPFSHYRQNRGVQI